MDKHLRGHSLVRMRDPFSGKFAPGEVPPGEVPPGEVPPGEVPRIELEQDFNTLSDLSSFDEDEEKWKISGDKKRIHRNGKMSEDIFFGKKTMEKVQMRKKTL